jgi:hypothetical protein
MSNIRFNYFYRDADNYKLFGSEVFSNPLKLDAKRVASTIKLNLIDNQFFYPTEWKLPLLSAEDGWGMDETDWCEFESVEETEEEGSQGSISEWLKTIRK